MVINFGVVCHLYESLQIGETRLKDFINLRPSETTWWRRRRRPAAAATSLPPQPPTLAPGRVSNTGGGNCQQTAVLSSGQAPVG